MAAGTLLTVSGIDGAGKSTLVRSLREGAESASRWPSVVVVAPLRGDADLVRSLTALPSPGGGAWPERERWLAGYFSLQLARTAESIRLPLAAGALVIADRWWPDHVVNQSHFDVDLAEWRDLAAALPVPDLSVWVDVRYDVARERVAARPGGGLGSREDFLRSAAAAFPLVMSGWPHHRVDGERPVEDSTREIVDLLTSRTQTTGTAAEAGPQAGACSDSNGTATRAGAGIGRSGRPSPSPVCDAVTLDGPSGVGKTAVARSLAGRLGWRWVSAGLLYRALAASAPDSGPARVGFVTAADGIVDPIVEVGRQRYSEHELQRPEWGAHASRLAQDPGVREQVSAELRRVLTGGLVLEGRSMHRVVPDAALSVYLWADRAERAARTVDAGLFLDDGREAADRGRSQEPLRLTAGMVAWDSTRYSLDQTVSGLVRRVRIALGGPARVAVLGLDGGGTVDLPALVADRSSIELVPTGSTDFVVRLPPSGTGTSDWLAAHLRVLLAGNDLVTVGPPVGAGRRWDGVNRNLTADQARLALAAGGNIGHTADLAVATPVTSSSTAPPRSEDAPDAGNAGLPAAAGLPASAAGARWVFVPEAVVPVASAGATAVVHVRTGSDRDRLLDRLQRPGSPTATNVLIVDHTRDAALPLLVEAAAPRRRIRIIGSEDGLR